jgi:hypothetical protein
MVVIASPARVAAILAGTLWFALLLPGGASILESSVSATVANQIVSVAALTKIQPLLAQADDLAAPPSPDAIVTTPPPASLAEASPPPLPGYAWDPGHWAWDGGQYVWQPGNYIIQPTNGATSPPVFGSNIPADGPGWTGAGSGEHRARASSGQPFRRPPICTGSLGLSSIPSRPAC